MQAGEGDGRETWICDNKDSGKCEGIHEMLSSDFLEPDCLVCWIKEQADDDMGFLMGRELSRAQNPHFMDCLQELLATPLLHLKMTGSVPDWGEFAHFLTGIVSGDGQRIVMS